MLHYIFRNLIKPKFTQGIQLLLIAQPSLSPSSSLTACVALQWAELKSTSCSSESRVILKLRQRNLIRSWNWLQEREFISQCIYCPSVSIRRSHVHVRLKFNSPSLPPPKKKKKKKRLILMQVKCFAFFKLSSSGCLWHCHWWKRNCFCGCTERAVLIRD